MSNHPYSEVARVDAFDKVRGKTVYAADTPLPGLLHAMLVPARIVKGKVLSVDVAMALATAGVVRVLTPQDTPAPPSSPRAGWPPPPMLQMDIAYRGQPIALVVAETLEAAIDGAGAVRATYSEEPFSVLFDEDRVPRDDSEAPVFGDADAALAGAATTVEAVYMTKSNHHNPMELLSTIAVWSGGKLTIYEGTQASSTVKNGVAHLLQIDRSDVEVVSPHVGGGFGQRGEIARHTAIVAQAARIVGRPVKLVVPRHLTFHNTRFRPHTQHRIKLGASSDGRMVSLHYDALQQNSRRGGFGADVYHDIPSKMYAIANYRGTCGDLRLDTQSPAHMRAPHEHPACFALESAVDELAHATGLDPVQLRLDNDTQIDHSTGKRMSSRFLKECLTRGAERFGWSARQSQPGSMRASDGTLIGWGVACGAYQSPMHPAIAKLRVSADGSTRYASAGHEMGQGIRTAIAQALLAGLRIDPSRLTISIGDTRAAPQHHTAGSWGTASSVPVASLAAERMVAAFDELLDGLDVAGNMHQQLARVRRPYIEIEVSMTAPGQGSEHLERLRAGTFAVGGLHGDYPEFTALSYIAHFVEVRVEPRTRRIRMPRVVSVADCGRVVSPRTARSQIQGGVVWALSAALREESEVDPRYGGWLNADIAEYHVAVNADIGDIDVSFIDQPDFDANRSGVKGVGEVAMTGAAAALANAVFHATGKRLRTLPIRIEDLLS